MHKSLIIALNQTVVGLLCWNLRKNAEEDFVLFIKEYQNTLWLSVILIWRFNLVLQATKKIQIWKLRIISFCFFLEENIFKSSYICVHLHLCVFYLCMLYSCVHMTAFVCGMYMCMHMWHINGYILYTYGIFMLVYTSVVYALYSCVCVLGVYLTCAIRSCHLMSLFFPPSIGTTGTHSHN